MDTVEELNGTYFYKGVCNISASELFFWIFLDKIDEQFGGIKDVVTMSCIILGLPLLKTRVSHMGQHKVHQLPPNILVSFLT